MVYCVALSSGIGAVLYIAVEDIPSVSYRTAIKTLFLYFKMCQSVKLGVVSRFHLQPYYFLLIDVETLRLTFCHYYTTSYHTQ
jgi:hypothetical protein